MPSRLDTALAQSIGVCLVASGHGVTLKALSGAEVGKSFTAILYIEPQISLSTELGTDPRDSVKAEFVGNQPALKQGDILADGKVRWKVLERLSTQAEPTVYYKIAEV